MRGMTTPRTRRSRLLAGIGVGVAVAVLGTFGFTQLRASPNSALQARIELLLYRPDAPELILAPGGESSPVIALTALRALRQIGDGAALPGSFESITGAGLDAIPPSDASYSFQSL